MSKDQIVQTLTIENDQIVITKFNEVLNGKPFIGICTHCKNGYTEYDKARNLCNVCSYKIC